MLRRHFFHKIPLYIGVVITTLVFLIPFIWLFTSAVSRGAGLAVEIRDFTLANFIDVLGEKEITSWVANSLIITVTTSVLGMFIGTMMGYSLSRLSFRGKRGVMLLILLTRTIPGVGMIVPVYNLCLFFGMIDTIFGIILVEMAFSIPFCVWMAKEFFDNMPRDFEEAAKVDGCNVWGRFFLIALPIMGPGVAVITIFIFVAVWGDFLIPFILLRSTTKFPLAVGLYKVAFLEYGAVKYGSLSALAILYAVVPVIIFLFLKKYLMKGMAMVLK